MKNTLVALVVLLLSGRAFGWGDIGHSAVGEIAERNLTPAAKALVCDVLGAEPLAVAATFPDHVRNDPRYKDFAPYHFIEIRPGIKAEEAIKASADQKNSHTLISQAPELIGRGDTPKAQKVIWMRYLVHLIGDVHQPLHVGNGLDMGANLCDTNWIDPETGRKEKLSLHSVWDDHIFDWEKKDFDTKNKGIPGKYFGYQTLVDNIEADNSEEVLAAKAELPKAIKQGPITWYEESQALHSRVYNDNVADPRTRPWCTIKDPETHKYDKSHYDKKKIPTLDEAYARKALVLAHKRILQAGHRLAAVLNDIAVRFPPANPSGEGCPESILNAVKSARAVDSVSPKGKSMGEPAPTGEDKPGADAHSGM